MSIAISLRAQHNGPSGVPTSFRFCGGDTAGAGKLTAVGTGVDDGGADASELDSGATDISTVEMLPQEPRSTATKVRAGRIFTLDFVTPGSTFAWGFDCTSTPVVEPNSLFRVVALRVSTVVFLRAAMKAAGGGGRLVVTPKPLLKPCQERLLRHPSLRQQLSKCRASRRSLQQMVRCRSQV